MVLMLVRQGGWNVWAVAKMLKRKLVSDFRQSRGLLTKQSDKPNRKRQLTLFPRDVMKRWDCCRWWWWDKYYSEATDRYSSKWVLRIFLFALRFYSQIWSSKLLSQSSGKRGEGSLLISARWKGGGGAGNRWSMRYYRLLGLDFRS
jgi:hypothetical protein